MEVSERRDGPRIPYSGQTHVYIGQHSVNGRAANLSTTGMLVFSSVRVPPGTEMRLCFTFASVDDWLEVEACSTHEFVRDGWYGWGARFTQVPPHVRTILRTVVRKTLRGEAGDPAFDVGAHSTRVGAASIDDTSRPTIGSPIRNMATGPVPKARVVTGPVPQARLGAQSLPEVIDDRAARLTVGMRRRGEQSAPTQPGEQSAGPQSTEPQSTDEQSTDEQEQLCLEPIAADPFADLPVRQEQRSDVVEALTELDDMRRQAEEQDVWTIETTGIRRLYRDAVRDVATTSQPPRKKGFFSRFRR